MKKQCGLGGIVRYKHNNICGYGFKTVFKSSEEAQRYKEMMMWIISGDGYRVNDGCGYYDKKTG